MKGDFSRRTFDPKKHYRSTLLQQGRALIDADWNEQNEIVSHRVETEALDTIGPCGAPIHEAGFAITPDGEGGFEIGRGRYYVDGILVQNDADVSYSAQEDLPTPPLIAEPGLYLVYLDVWHRHVTVLDDDLMREVALGGPDTTTRAKTVWQVKWYSVPSDVPAEDVNCLDVPGFGDAISASDGEMSARSEPEGTESDPCIVPPSAGFQGLENQLYRVEIHESGSPVEIGNGASVPITDIPEGTTNQVAVAPSEHDWNSVEAVEVYRAGPGSDPMNGMLAYIIDVGQDGLTLTLNTDLPVFAPEDQPRLRVVDATFKWSRDNGSVVTAITRINGTEITVSDVGRDIVLGFSPDQWVEITDDDRELKGLSGQLVQIASVEPAKRIIRVKSDAAPLASPPVEGENLGVDPSRRPKLRRWDGIGPIKVDPSAPSESWLELESGIQVRFSDGMYQSHDYWTIPARTANADASSGNIEWPIIELDDGEEPASLGPKGIDHHYCPLALLQAPEDEEAGIGEILLLEPDCRVLFPPVTELTTLVYVGGDGQEAMPGHPIPAPLQVDVFNGHHPVSGQTVSFTAHPDTGRLAEDHAALPGSGEHTIQVETDPDGIASCAWMLDPDGDPSQQVVARLLDAAGREMPPVVRFNGQLSIASQVAYDPSACENLSDVSTVQEAIDVLCRLEPGGCHCVTVGEGGQFDNLNDAIMTSLRQDETAICICLLNGTHEVPGLELSREGFERAVDLTIVGCGPGSRIELLDNMRLERLSSFTLCDVDIVASQEANIEIIRCHEVQITGIALAGIIRERSLLMVQAAGRFLCRDNIVEAALSEELEMPRRFFDGIGEIEELFQFGQAREFHEAAQRFAHELSSLNPGERRRITNDLRPRLEEFNRILSPGEAESFQRLISSLIARQPDPVQLARDLTDIRLRTLDVDPGPAIEISAPPESRDELTMYHFERATLENNRITGTVSIYGAPDPERTSISPREGFGERLRPMLQQHVIRLEGGTGTLNVLNNRLTRLVVSQEIIEHLAGLAGSNGGTSNALIANYFVTDNVIDGERNQLITQHMAMTGNHFTQLAVRSGEVPNVVASVVADAATYTANHASLLEAFDLAPAIIFNITRASSQAANLEVEIV